MSTSRHPAPAYASAPRVHPYAQPAARRRSPAAPAAPAADERRMPPSPPRSHHESSASPPLTKASAALDPNDNYWDDVPPAPASLKSILDSFRRSGEGDRDLLMAILNAKKSEEERLTAIIQTRLTILQARLNLAAIQAAGPSPPQAADYFSHPRERSPALSRSASGDAPPAPAPAPAQPQYYYQPRPSERERERIHLPPPMMYARGERSPRERDERERERERRLPPMREDDETRSPDARAGGLEMLLEGVREAERKERV